MNINNFALVGTVIYVRPIKDFVKIGLEYQTFEGQQKQLFDLIAYDDICYRMKFRVKPGQIISVIGTMSQHIDYYSNPTHNLINLKVKEFQVIVECEKKPIFTPPTQAYPPHFPSPPQTYNAPPDASNLSKYRYGKFSEENVEMPDYKMSDFNIPPESFNPEY